MDTQNQNPTPSSAKIGIWGVVVRGAILVGSAMLAALQVDPQFALTGQISRRTVGAIAVVGGLALLSFLSQSITRFQDDKKKEEETTNSDVTRN